MKKLASSLALFALAAACGGPLDESTDDLGDPTTEVAPPLEDMHGQEPQEDFGFPDELPPLPPEFPSEFDPELDDHGEGADLTVEEQASLDQALTPPAANCPRARVDVATGNELNVRTGATTSARVVTKLPDTYMVTVLGTTTGDSVSGNRTWLRVSAPNVEGYAAGYYMRCTTDPLPISQTCPRVEIDVANGASLNVRPTASRSGTPIAQLQDGRVVGVLDAVQGEAIDGNRRWYKVRFDGKTGFVFSAFADCTRAATTGGSSSGGGGSTTRGYMTPLACGTRARIVQGNNGSYSHTGRTAYAWDYSIPLNTPLTAMEDGRVDYIYNRTRPGHRCYNGGGSDCYPYSNMVVLKHPDGSLTQYKHMNRVDVTVGQQVRRGQRLGLSGSTGYSTGPHAHVMRMTDCNLPNCQSIRTTFKDQPGDGIPVRGEVVRSGNCP